MALAIALPAGAQEPDPERDGTAIGPGPLGRPYTRWAADYFRWWDAAGRDAVCETVGTGGVVFVPHGGPGTTVACTMEAGQRILVMAEAFTCGVDASLERRLARAHEAGWDRRAELLAEHLLRQRAEAWWCLDHATTFLRQASLSIDGRRSILDDGFLAVSEPVTSGGEVRRIVTYLVMLDPLTPGRHRIEVGSTVGSGEHRSTSYVIDLEVGEDPVDTPAVDATDGPVDVPTGPGPGDA